MYSEKLEKYEMFTSLSQSEYKKNILSYLDENKFQQITECTILNMYAWHLE